jgi:hypothetical protein
LRGIEARGEDDSEDQKAHWSHNTIGPKIIAVKGKFWTKFRRIEFTITICLITRDMKVLIATRFRKLALQLSDEAI